MVDVLYLREHIQLTCSCPLLVNGETKIACPNALAVMEWSSTVFLLRALSLKYRIVLYGLACLQSRGSRSVIVAA